MIEYVEEVHIESEPQTFFHIPDLEGGRILEPLPGTVHVLVSPGMEIVIVRHALHRPVVQWNPNVIRIPERRYGGPGGRIGRKRRLAPRDQRRCGGLVIRRYAHNAVGPSTGVHAVDL